MEELTAFRKYLVEVKTSKPKETLIKESSVDQVNAYWDIMVKNQPEDVIRMLTDLVTNKITFDSFMFNVKDDIEDSFKDEDFEAEDEFLEDFEDLTEGKSETTLSNQILDFLESNKVIQPNDAQKIHKALTKFLEDKNGMNK